MTEEWIGALAFVINICAGGVGLLVAIVFRNFLAIPPRGGAASAWLAHGVNVAWIATSAISLFWATKWAAQGLGEYELAFAISKWGGIWDAVWRSLLIWAGIAHLIASRKST